MRVPESHLRWLLFAVFSAVACAVVAQANPIDRALPFIAVGLALCGWLIRDSGWAAAVELSVPLLIATAMFVIDERTRVMLFGTIVAGAFSATVYAAERTLSNDALLTVLGTLLLRWIPFRDVVLWRELIVLLGALAVLVALRNRSPMNIAVALAVALVTPVFPGRAMLYPFILAAVLSVGQAILPVLSIPLLVLAYFDRYSHATLWIVAAIAVAIPHLRRVRVPVYAAAIGLFGLWPWSGIVARAFPVFLFATPASPRAEVFGLALGAGQSVSIDVPRSDSVIVTSSGANVARMRPGRVIGTIDSVDLRREVRIGDIADFGFLRREQFFFSRNTVPRWPTNDIRGYGQTAWLHGAGRVRVPPATSIRITAAQDLPPAARLQIESVDFE